jgi:hypothetical protein
MNRLGPLNEAPPAKRGWLKFLEYDGFGDLDLKFFLNPGYGEL